MTPSFPPSLQALTLWPEWAWAVTHLGKSVENRTWERPAFNLVGRWLAIHAGQRIGGGEVPAPQAIAMVWEMAGEQTRALAQLPTQASIPTSAIVAVVLVDRVGYDVPSPWSVPGAWQMHFGRVGVLDAPVPCRGRQGLWMPPAPAVGGVREQWDRIDWRTP